MIDRERERYLNNCMFIESIKQNLLQNTNFFVECALSFSYDTSTLLSGESTSSCGNGTIGRPVL